MTYHLLREFADSWALLAMALLYIGFVGWAFRPRAKGHHDQAATMIFEEESHHG
jgi:cytochrome c oxidase cbb3-type subunit IV